MSEPTKGLLNSVTVRTALSLSALNLAAVMPWLVDNQEAIQHVLATYLPATMAPFASWGFLSLVALLNIIYPSRIINERLKKDDIQGFYTKQMLVVPLIALSLFATNAEAMPYQPINLMTATSQTADTTGTATVKGAVSPYAVDFVGEVISTNNSGTTPTMLVTIEYSLNCSTNWKTLITFDSIETVATTPTKMSQSAHVDSSSLHPGNCFRAVTDLGGTNPNYNVAVKLWYGVRK